MTLLIICLIVALTLALAGALMVHSGHREEEVELHMARPPATPLEAAGHARLDAALQRAHARLLSAEPAADRRPA